MTDGFFLLKQIKVNGLGHLLVACHIEVQMVGINGLRICPMSYYKNNNSG